MRDVRAMSPEEHRAAAGKGAGIAAALMQGTLVAGALAEGAGIAASSQVGAGTTVYRVYGGDSKQMGAYWTTANPNATPNFPAGAGLPAQNAMANVVEGVITDANGIRVTTAAPGAHGPGGLPEVQIPNAAAQVKVTNVVPFKPVGE